MWLQYSLPTKVWLVFKSGHQHGHPVLIGLLFIFFSASSSFSLWYSGFPSSQKPGPLILLAGDIYQATGFLSLATSVSRALFNSFLVLYICNLMCNFYHIFICYCMHGFLGYQIFVSEETLCWNNYLSVLSSFWNWKVPPPLNKISSVQVWLFFFCLGH